MQLLEKQDDKSCKIPVGLAALAFQFHSPVGQAHWDSE
jgi:hypothetical protein